MKNRITFLSLLFLLASWGHANEIAEFHSTGFLHEQQREWKTSTGVRILINAAGDFNPARATQLILYALPNGNTIEWTMGARLVPGMDWHYDIQHIGAQVRKLRLVDRGENVVLACLEADKRSWPAWRHARPNNAALIRAIVSEIDHAVPGSVHRIALVAHSGGGSFIFGYLNGGESIPPIINRIAWIDATYAYNDAEHHCDKLLAWLDGDPSRRLVVIAYDDSRVRLNGKPIVSPTGGTWYRSHKMIERFERDVKFASSRRGEIEQLDAMNRQIRFLLHSNPDRKILHTVLVERNGLLEAMTFGTPLHDQWGGTFWGPRAYSDLIAPALASSSPSSRTTTTAAATQPAAIPPRPAGAPGGRAFAESVADLPLEARDAAIVQAILEGNIPDFQRHFCPVRSSTGGHECIYEVLPDYLAIGSDRDYVRMPMSPMSARAIARAFGCTLPTTKMVDQIYQQAQIKLDPRPLIQDRESVLTFIQHNDIIQQQLAGRAPGALVAGDKKDVVQTTALKNKPHKVAIYGWHKLDGKPIQPLYTGHADWYRDYSHGIRLVKQSCQLDGKPATIDQILSDPNLKALLTNE